MFALFTGRSFASVRQLRRIEYPGNAPEYNPARLDSYIHIAHNFALSMSPQAMPVFHRVKKTITDPDEFADALSGTTLKVDILAGKFAPATVERFQTADWTLDLGEIHVKARARAELPKGWCSLGFMRGQGSSIWHGMKAESGALVCNPPGGDGPDGQVMPGFAWAAVGAPATLWDQCQALAGAEVAGKLTGVAHWQMPAPLFASLNRQLCETHSLLQSLPGMPELAGFANRAVFNFVRRIAIHAWEATARVPSFPDSVRNRARLARRAETWMEDRLAEPIRVPEVCLALRVSRRELEYAFRSTFDISPQLFLNRLRLNAIHRALLRAEPRRSVTSIAFDHGIVHLGRFAEAYWRLFGERPSDTLRRNAFPDRQGL